jgi:hypothetical protein
MWPRLTATAGRWPRLAAGTSPNRGDQANFGGIRGMPLLDPGFDPRGRGRSLAWFDHPRAATTAAANLFDTVDFSGV